MKIAIFADTFFPSVDGVVSSIVSTAKSLEKQGHQVRFFVPKPVNLKEARRLAAGLDVVWVRSVGFFAYDAYRISSPTSWSAKKAFLDFKPDVVHVHTPFSLGWMGSRWARRHRIPVVATYHTLIPEFLMYLPIPVFNKTRLAKFLTWRYTELFYRRADVVTTPTQEMAVELEKNGIPAKVLSNPIRFSLFNRFADSKRSSKLFSLVFFGRLSFEKNIEVLLEMLRLLLDRKLSVELVIVGSGPAEEFLKKTALELKVGSHVRFRGVLRDEQLALEVAKCHCMVTASTIETQGLTILEAMAAGVPCVGVDFLGIPNSVKENENGFLFPPGDPKTGADKVEKLFSSKTLQKNFSRKAIETARPLSEESIVSQYVGVYLAVVSGKKHPKAPK